MALTDKLTAIANAIRSKTGKSGKLTLDAMPAEIAAISSGGGLPKVDLLREDDFTLENFTATSATSVLSMTDSKFLTYPFLLVQINNNDTSAVAYKFVSSATVVSNAKYDAGGTPSVNKFGCQLFRSSSNILATNSSTTYGIWGYNLTSGGKLDIRARAYSAYYPDLSGNYKVRVYGIKL